MKFPLPKNVFFLLSVLALLTSCDRLNVETVREGTLDFDTSKTLGDAFEKSDVISGGKWTGFEATDGSHVVQFNGELTGLQEELDQAFAKVPQNLQLPQLMALAASGGSPERRIVDLSFLANTPLRIESCDYQIQFLLSKRDDSFDIGSTELKAKIANTETGTSKEHTFTDEEGDVLASIYDNDKVAVAIYVLAEAKKADMAAGLLQQLQN